MDTFSNIKTEAGVKQTDDGVIQTKRPEDIYASIPSTDGGTISNLTPYEGNVNWTYTGTDPIGCETVIQDGVMYTGTSSGIVYSINISDRTQNWTYEPETGIHSILYHNGNLYIFEGNNVRCLDAADGSVIWTQSTNDNTGGSPLSLGGGRVYHLSNDGNLYADDMETGDRLWSTEITSDYSYGSDSPSYYNGDLYFNDGSGYYYSIDASDGSENWSQGFDEQVDGTYMGFRDDSRSVVRDGIIFCGGSDGDNAGVIAIETSGYDYGALTPDGYSAWPPCFPVPYGSEDLGVIYTSTTGVIVGAYINEYGNHWSYDLGDPNTHAKAISVVNGYVVVIDDMGTVTALDADTGELDLQTTIGINNGTASQEWIPTHENAHWQFTKSPDRLPNQRW